jgi:hypothetical protein
VYALLLKKDSAPWSKLVVGVALVERKGCVIFTFENALWYLFWLINGLNPLSVFDCD